MKENDYLLNCLSNPTFTTADFREVGLDTNNTSLETKEKYKNLDVVKTNSMFQTNGKFDDAKFDKYYSNVAMSYQMLDDETTDDEILS